MIKIGLTGWGDHDDLYEQGTSNRNKLQVYSRHFSIVEVDSSFYAIQSQRNYQKWVDDTPENFSFIIKAYQGMTGHDRGRNPFDRTAEMFQAFKESVEPVIQSGKLKAVLFQYPPWFACLKESVDILRYTKEQMEEIPTALEFRHQSWFTPDMKERTLDFMRKEGWIHSICDEPQSGVGSIPTVLSPTNPEFTLVRFHGRNVQGWNNKGTANWRDVRYLYRYNEEELMEWKEHLKQLQRTTSEICVLFNNNSGGDASDNAKQLMALLGMSVEPSIKEPEQLDLFDL